MAGYIGGEKTSHIPEESLVSSSHTYRVEVVDEIETVLNPGEEFYEVEISPDGRQINHGKKVVEHTDVEVVHRGKNSDEDKGPDKRVVYRGENPNELKNNNAVDDTFNTEVNNAAFLYLDENGGPGDLITNFGGSDDGGFDGGFF